MIKVKPLEDFILFKTITVKISSGIVLPDDSKMKSNLVKNIVKAVGPKVKTVKKGNEIVILPGARLKLDYPERDFEPDLYMTRLANVCAVFV